MANKLKFDFEIPKDVKNDMVYCDRAINSHVKLYQDVTAASLKMPEYEHRYKKCLEEIEKEIIDIGSEQRLLHNRLRFHIDMYHISKGLSTSDRLKFTQQIRDEILTKIEMCGDNIQPKNVTKRLKPDALFTKYLGPTALDSWELNNGIKQEKPDNDNEFMNGVNAKVRYPLHIKTKSIQSKHDEWPKIIQPSLLKPISQRGQPLPTLTPINILSNKSDQTKIDQTKVEQPSTLTKSRFNLKQALYKAAAKDDVNGIKPNVEIIKNRITTDSPDTVTYVPSPKSITTVSSSSNSSSSEEKDDEMVNDQERFLRNVGLYTSSYCTYLQNRRPQRKRRSCTSTERGDFHYGKFELYERQFSKRSKRQFLYSPPATRAKRRVASNIETTRTITDTSAPEKKEFVILPKRNRPNPPNSSASSSSSTSTAPHQVCVTCHKQNNLLECALCCAKFHLSCHFYSTSPSLRKSHCPVCCRKPNISRIKPSTSQIIAAK